ncbi:hypothetical protein TNCV_3203511 [Trichonephila clavipes]|nr:hypothetical protein TNCV_3203511 [Trichonephila clavipes]
MEREAFLHLISDNLNVALMRETLLICWEDVARRRGQGTCFGGIRSWWGKLLMLIKTLKSQRNSLEETQKVDPRPTIGLQLRHPKDMFWGSHLSGSLGVDCKALGTISVCQRSKMSTDKEWFDSACCNQMSKNRR